VETNRIVFLLIGQALFVEFVSDNRIAYRFSAKITGRELGNIPMLILSEPAPEQIRKIQRRQYVRVDAALDIALRFPESNIKMTAVTKDISSGGCAVYIPEGVRLRENEEGKALLVLPMKDGHVYLKMLISVVRLFESSGKPVVSLKFLDTTALDRQRIMRFCFEQQVELRKKGFAG
jgi:c-di-GMP-binding flagellar brake protein YcgR